MTLTATNVRDAVESSFQFSVDKLPLFGPDRMPTKHYGLFRSDTEECIGMAVSKRYGPHTGDHVATLAEAGAYAMDRHGMIGSVSCHWKDGHRVFIKPTDDQRREICDGDGVFPMLSIHAGYDGTPFRFTLGMFRDVCRNLSMIEKVGGMSLSASIRHTQSLNFKVADLVDQVQALTDRTDDMIESFREANQREVQLADFVMSVYPIANDATPRTQASHRERMRLITRRVWRERDQVNTHRTWGDGVVTAWEAFNAVQGYEQHDARRRNVSGTMDRAITAFGNKAVTAAAGLAFA